MKRQKRILAGAAAMLLALGMLIGCDTPANSGSSDGGSAGGSITLPEGDSTAENKLVGTWERADNYSDVYVLNKNGTCKNGNDEGTWSATDTKLSMIFEVSVPPAHATTTLTYTQSTDTLKVGDITLTRKTDSSNSVEGTWEYPDGELIITSNTFKHTSMYDETQIWVSTGIRTGNTLTIKKMEVMYSLSYSLSADGTTLTMGNYIYTKQNSDGGNSDGGNVGGDIQNPDDSDGDGGNSDGGSTGGSITLPEGDSTAKNKLVGTWVREGNDPDVYILNNNGTCKNGKFNEGGTVSEGTWSATDTELSMKYTMPAAQLPSFKTSVIGDTLTLTIIQDDNVKMSFLREKGSGDSLEGTWRYSSEAEVILLEIDTDSCMMKQTYNHGNQKTDIEYTGSREGDTLTLKEGVNMSTIPYTLSEDGNTLKLFFEPEYSSTYTKQ